MFWNALTVTTATWVYVVLFSLSGFRCRTQRRDGDHRADGQPTPASAGSAQFDTADALGTALGSILAGVDHLALRPC
ncbi:MAG: hypothetical protein R2694_02520 [Ilumatobacteraceae bacterium]